MNSKAYVRVTGRSVAHWKSKNALFSSVLCLLEYAPSNRRQTTRRFDYPAPRRVGRRRFSGGGPERSGGRAAQPRAICPGALFSSNFFGTQGRNKPFEPPTDNNAVRQIAAGDLDAGAKRTVIRSAAEDEGPQAPKQSVRVHYSH